MVNVCFKLLVYFWFVVRFTAEPTAAPAGASPSSPALSPANSLEASTPTVAQPKRIMGVGFGDIFKEGSVKLKPRTPVGDSEIKKPEKVKAVYVISPSSVL